MNRSRSVGDGRCLAWPLPADASCAKVARRMFTDAVADLQLPAESVEDGILMASELAANTLHARGCGGGGIGSYDFNHALGRYSRFPARYRAGAVAACTRWRCDDDECKAPAATTAFCAGRSSRRGRGEPASYPVSAGWRSA